jgi:hypothetical protein
VGYPQAGSGTYLERGNPRLIVTEPGVGYRLKLETIEADDCSSA